MYRPCLHCNKKNVDNFNSEFCPTGCEYGWDKTELKKYETIGDYDRLRALAEADRDGRCVVLPCKVGDTVYITVRGIVEDTKVRTFFMGHPSYHGGELDPKYYMVRLTDYDIPMRDFGKDWFLTRAEAEATLASFKQADSKLASSKSVPSLIQVSSKLAGEEQK